MALFSATMVNEVHVLLVGNEVVSLLDTKKLLEFNSYKVTEVTVISIASSILAKEKVKYDIVMVDVSSSDDQVFMLVHQAINMGHMVIYVVMADNPSVALMKSSIEDGAFMFIQKPAPMDVLKYLWQHVLREKTRKAKEEAKFRETMSSIERSNPILNSGRDMVPPCSNMGASTTNVQEPRPSEEDATDHKGKKPKVCIVWNQELHEKFLEAGRVLGEGRCFPKNILKLMNVPGLKRMQVASHLQKCRLQGWIPPQQRRQEGESESTESGDSKAKRQRSYTRRAKGVQPKFVFGEEEKDEQPPSTQAVEHSIGPIEPDNMIQNIEGPDHNVSNDIANVNETRGDTMINAENVVGSSNHEGVWTIPFDESLDFAGLYNPDGVNQMDENFEGIDLDEFFSQQNPDNEADEDPASFWRSFFPK